MPYRNHWTAAHFYILFGPDLTVAGLAVQEPLDRLAGLVGGVQVMGHVNQGQVSIPLQLSLDEGHALAGSGHGHAPALSSAEGFAFGEQVFSLGEQIQVAAAGDQFRSCSLGYLSISFQRRVQG